MVPVPMTSEEQSALQTLAAAQGVSVDTLLRNAVFQLISEFREVNPRQQLSPAGWDLAGQEIARSIPDFQDKALYRRKIYSRIGES